MFPEAVRSHRKPGFTLIEVLVVVAIIALLVAILLPSLKNAREQGRAIACGSNMDQIFTGSFIYTQQNKDWLPNYGWVVSDDWWAVQIARNLGAQFDVYACPSDENPLQYFSRMDRGKIHIYKTLQAGAAPLFISYSGACDTVGLKITDFKRPATSLILIEAIDAESSVSGATGGCMRYSRLLKYADRKGLNRRQFKSPWTRHGGRTNFLFVDGHVGRHTPEEVVNQIAYQQEFYDQKPVRK